MRSQTGETGAEIDLKQLLNHEIPAKVIAIASVSPIYGANSHHYGQHDGGLYRSGGDEHAEYQVDG